MRHMARKHEARRGVKVTFAMSELLSGQALEAEKLKDDPEHGCMGNLYPPA
jgi:hypothetical protein